MRKIDAVTADAVATNATTNDATTADHLLLRIFCRVARPSFNFFYMGYNNLYDHGVIIWFTLCYKLMISSSTAGNCSSRLLHLGQMRHF